MDRDAQENVIRRAYAKQIVAEAGVSDRRIEAAFASVKPEDFLGRGPWQIVRWGRGYVPTPSRNPVYLYDDVVVAIIPERHLNNGQPSLHATLIASAAWDWANPCSYRCRGRQLHGDIAAIGRSSGEDHGD